MLTVRKIYYRGRRYWLLQANAVHSVEQKLQSLPDCRWSRTKNGWLFPATKGSWATFQAVFEPSEYQVETAYFSPKLSGHKARFEFEVMPIDASRAIVRMRKFTKQHLEVIRRVESARYHADVRYWSVPVEIIEEVKKAFEALDDE